MAKVGQMSVLRDLDVTAIDANYAPFVEQLRTAKPRPVVPAWPKIDDLLQKKLQAAFRGETTLQEALDSAADRSTSCSHDRSAVRGSPAHRRRGTIPYSPPGAAPTARPLPTPYAFLAPTLVLFTVVMLVPIARAVQISLYEWSPIPGADNTFVGGANYQRALADPDFQLGLLNAGVYMVVTCRRRSSSA